MADQATLSRAGSLAAAMQADRVAGLSDETILRKHADDLAALLTAPNFLSVILTILPKALPLIIGIVGDLRSGKKLLEILLSRTSEIVEVVLAVVGILTPAQQVSNTVAPVVPK